MVGILSKIAPSYQWFNNTKTSGIVVAAVGTGILILWRKKLNDLKRKRKDDPDDLHISLAEEKAAKKEKAAVDALFFRYKTLPPAGYLTLVALSLIARTYCDVWMINNSTATERSIISGDHADFRKNLTEFVFALPFISVINQLMKLGLNELKLRFRARLTKHLYGQYLNSFTFYRMSNLDNRIANADQLLTQDVDKFCNSLAELYSNVSKSGYLTLVALSLIARTYCDVWMINNSTATERSIISGDHADFRKNLTEFVFALPFISVINQLMKLGLNELKLRFRARLTRHLYGQYLNSFTFYRMSNLDNRIANADQLLTQDVDKFCNSLAELYSNVSKPLLDIAIYIQKLTGAIGIQGPALMLGYMAVSGLLLTRLRRPVGKMTAEEQHHEGEFRYVNSRLITNSEEIAFYQGGKRERMTMENTFQRLVNHIRGFIQFKFIMGIIDNVIAKYLATLVGFYVVSRPFLDKNSTRHASSTHSQKMEDYYKSGRMLVKMAEAIGRLVLAGRELATLAGTEVYLHEEMEGILKKLTNGDEGIIIGYFALIALYCDLSYLKQSVNQSIILTSFADRISADCLDPSKGQIVQVDHLIRFENVPLVTPNGDVLIKELSFEVRSGMNVLVCGPNGCGKSSLFRILGELWPLFGGKLVKPNKSKLFYIPQVSVGITLFTVSHRKSLWKYHEYVLYMDGRGAYEYKPIDSAMTEFGS
ncbi:PREDICTED: ATP-binding cassette sub-family D member 3-like [Acropora digitifera]|uniref:ATP-binding cassette sub-family D member 3-like n=1 Tax=Acropora digitifera TaxID=70779 RepID=UPI00077A2DBA|nr:PREDICTED: ATP-binding cassette sub-family D member 3-like [Acropora digitifera]